MGNLIKMDFYRMLKAKSFLVCNIVVFAIAIGARLIELGLYRLSATMGLSEASVPLTTQLSDILCNPTNLTMALIVIFISAVIFSYSDIANGYVKNIAGQVSNKGDTAISKFIVLTVHNLIFMLCGLLGRVIIAVITGGIVFDGKEIPLAVGTFIVKWLLTNALCAVLLFVSTGLKNKTFASVLGVIFGSGALMLIHLMIDSTVQKMIKVDISEYDPSLMLQQSNLMFGNAIVVALVVIAIFLPLTVKIFNKTDVK